MSGVLRAARVAVALAAEADPSGGGRRLLGTAGAQARIRAELADVLVPAPLPVIRSVGLPPLGHVPGATPDRVNLVPSVRLAYLTAAQADGIAALAQWYEADLRLAPWRGLVLGNISRAAAGDAARAFERLGATLDAADGFAGIAACAGTQGCDAAHADVRGDAERLARRFAEAGIGGTRSVVLAGCEKRCGMRRGADVELIADVLGYDLRIDGSTVSLGASTDEAVAEVMTACGEAAPNPAG